MKVQPINSINSNNSYYNKPKDQADYINELKAASTNNSTGNNSFNELYNQEGKTWESKGS